MDPLEKALAKAKNQTTNTQKPQKITEHTDKTVNYTQTKKHEINFDTLRQRRVVAQENHGVEAETFRLLRTKVLKQLRDNNWNSFAITAPGQDAGKSMVSVNLAISIAKEVNQTVLLVDLDLRFPKLHWYFDIKPEAGLRDYLLSDVPLNELLINPGFERLVLLPGRGQAVGSSELLSGPKMQAMVEEIKQRYQSRIIIFDLPPILAVDDVLACMDYFDAALLVVEEGGTKPEDITKSIGNSSFRPKLNTFFGIPYCDSLNEGSSDPLSSSTTNGENTASLSHFLPLII